MYDISAYQPTDDNIWFTVEENEDYIFMQSIRMGIYCIKYQEN